jgi:hypothetical protein
MVVPKDAFRRFQEELAAIDRQQEQRTAQTPAEAKLAQARSEFLALRERHQLTVADVIAFFPEEEGITYLQQLIAQAEAKPARGKKAPSAA